jgi:flagellar motor switch protein FliG
MNLNEQRRDAYNRIVKGSGSAAEPDAAKMPAPGRVSPKQALPKQTAPIPEKRDSVKLPGLVKVPSSGSNGKDSPYRKVAKFLLLIGVEEAAKVMSKLSPEQTEKVVLELASIRRVDKDEAAIVLAEFEFLLKQAKEPTGGIGTARTILEAAFGNERADQMLRKAVPDMDGKPFEYLEGVDPSRVWHLIADELPAVRALVLSQMKPQQAANVIKCMSDGEKKETVLRLAKLKSINPDVVRRVDSAMREKVEAVRTSSDDSIDGRSALAAILKHMDGSSENAILRGLSDSDPDLGKDLRERLFTVEDIVNADDKYLQQALRPLSDHDLAVLVAGKDEDFRKKLFANISRTRGAVVLEEEKIISPVTRSESERVTGSFFAGLRRAWENGDLFISGRDDKEVWI